MTWAILAVVYACGIPIVGTIVAREANRQIALGLHPMITSNRMYKLLVTLFALGWPALVLFNLTVRAIVLYSRAKGINIEDDDDPPGPPTPNGAT